MTFYNCKLRKNKIGKLIQLYKILSKRKTNTQKKQNKKINIKINK